MKKAYFCTLGLLMLAFMTTHAEAQDIKLILVHTAKPITRVYPGVDASVLGMRTGMSVSKAEVIARRIYGKKPQLGLGFSQYMLYGGNGFTIKSQPVVDFVTFYRYHTVMSGKNYEGTDADMLHLLFTPPLKGSSIYAIVRNIKFSQVAPPINAIEASLIKKYGPPSYQHEYGSASQKHQSLYGQVVIAWIFNQTSRLICKSYSCVGRTVSAAPYYNISAMHPYYAPGVRKLCGTSAGSPAVFKILVTIDLRGKTGQYKTLAKKMSVTMWDVQSCVNGAELLRNQFKVAAAKLR